MNNFAEIRQIVPLRQAAGMYGLEVDRFGSARCIFHGDNHPSMRLYDDHFHCYACGAHGDATDLTAQLFGLTKSEAADKLCSDFGISATRSPPIATKRTRILSDRERVQRVFDVLTDYIVMLREFREQYAPNVEDENPDPRFVLSLQQLEYAEYLWDELLDSTESERLKFINTNISQFRRYYDILKKYGKLRPAWAEGKGGVRCVSPDSSEQTGNRFISELSAKGIQYEYPLDGSQRSERQSATMTEINGRVKCVQPEERTENYGRKAG